MAQPSVFSIAFTTEGMQDLRELRKYEQKRVVAAIELQLAQQPEMETRNRKHLRPNRLASREMRVDEFRVFYDVDVAALLVSIIAIGRKDGDKLFVHGEEFDL